MTEIIMFKRKDILMKKTLSIVMTLSLLLSTTLFTTATETEMLPEDSISIIENNIDVPKFTESFKESVNYTNDFNVNNTNSVSGTNGNENSDDEDYVSVFIRFDYPSLDLSALRELDVSERRKAVKDYYYTKNTELIAELGLINCTASYFAPYAEISYDSLAEYYPDRNFYVSTAEDDSISHIDVDVIEISPDTATVATSSPLYQFSQALIDVGVTNNEYDGTGIKIGVYDDGIPDANLFPTNKYHLDEELYQDVEPSTHCGFVASIAGGKYGIAKNADFYFFPYTKGIVNGFNYLIGECDVDVINMSVSNSARRYSYASAFIDYQINITGCIIVTSAGNIKPGNESSINIGAYALAVNTIAVGGSDANFNLYSGSTRISLMENILKPDLVAPGANIANSGGKTDNKGVYGTSGSAPFVTGIIAKLMHEFPNLKANPSLVRAVLMAGCTHLSGQTDNIDEFAGAGLVNYENSRSIMSKNNFSSGMSYGSDPANTVIFESWFDYPLLSTMNIMITRDIPGSNVTPSGTEKDIKFQKYRIRIINYDVPGIFEQEIVFDSNVANMQLLKNVQYRSYRCRIQVIKRGSVPGDLYENVLGEDGSETISVAFTGANHVHKYTANYLPLDTLRHISCCSCGQTLQETHVFNDSGDCTKCGYHQ